MVLAGDPFQLPPTVLSQKAADQGLGLTLFERLYKKFGVCVLSAGRRLRPSLRCIRGLCVVLPQGMGWGWRALPTRGPAVRAGGQSKPGLPSLLGFWAVPPETLPVLPAGTHALICSIPGLRVPAHKGTRTRARTHGHCAAIQDARLNWQWTCDLQCMLPTTTHRRAHGACTYGDSLPIRAAPLQGRTSHLWFADEVGQ